jgi:ectoine hydroxylase-related dioxygenase (phytanoyl-CoA dioxygenase family)
LFPLRVLSTAEAHAYRTACDELELLLGGKPRTIDVRQMHLHFSWAYSLATRPAILDAVESLLGPNLLIWATELFAKHATDAAVSIGWHQDVTYMRFNPAQTTTAWIALGDSTIDNGCMRAVPGPERHDIANSTADRAKENGRQGKHVVHSVNEEKVVDVVLKSGEMSLHDAEILHGSNRNTSHEKRVGFVVRYVSPEAHSPAGRPTALLARGTNSGQNFTVVDPPDDASIGRALAGMKESAARHFDAVLENLRRV